MIKNFIVAKLCNNDYGQTLAEGLLEAILDYIQKTSLRS